ncbi:adhesion G-protein coupled receptor G4 [Rousettus aegyptiacus]|uniref:adhesion G-protein coupled receptor G4 n=1 Tax=Rousettus aegyptiacus TaxID=9407 RepID=UPI00168D14A7|nr:adhesion G-protein coupled receptor G4 [Rousettus aegyptiacus]
MVYPWHNAHLQCGHIIHNINTANASEALSLKGKRLDFYGRADTYVSLMSTIPELRQFTACIDLVFVDDKSSDWMAFSYITNNTFLGREGVISNIVIDLGLSGDHQQLILYNLGKIFYIPYHLTPFQRHTVCLMWNGVKGRLELFLNKERILVMMDQPQNLTPNGTLVLGHFLKNRDSQVKSVVPCFTGSLYYFQLWDHILENEQFMKCLAGNVVGWEEDIWLVNKIIPTVDMRLCFFVSENLTIQETNTTLSQQIDLTTPSQVTGLKPQKTIYSSTVVSKSMPVFATDHTTITHSNTTSPSLEMTAPNFLKTSIAETVTFTVDILSTSAAIAQPTNITSMGTTTNYTKIIKSPSSESTKTTKMTEVIAAETFHPTIATDFLYTSGFTKNSIVSKTSANGSQLAIRKTSLFSSIKSTAMSTSWAKKKSTGARALSISTVSQEFLASTVAGTVPWLTIKQTSPATTYIETASVFPPESVLIATATPVDVIFPRNQTACTLATTDTVIPFEVHSMTLPTKPIVTTPELTAETELTSTNFQYVSPPRVEDTISTFMPKEDSPMALTFRTSSSFTGAQNVQTVIDAETTHTALTTGIILASKVVESMFSPIITGPVYTQITPTDGENLFPFIFTRSPSTFKASESGPTSINDEGAHLFSTSEITWISRPDQTLLTSVFHGSTSNTGHSFTTTNIIIPSGTPIENKASTTTDSIFTTDAIADRYTTALSNLTSLWFTDFSTVSGTISVTKLHEFKLTNLLLKSTPMFPVAGNELLSTPRETVIPPVDKIYTLADIEPFFSTEENASEITQTDIKGTIAFGETTIPVPESTTTQRFNATVTRKETTSHYLKGKSETTEVSPFATMLETTEESAQMVTDSITISSFPDLEKLSTPLDDETVTTEMRGSWLSTQLVKITPKSSYNGMTEILNHARTYTAHWTSETPLEGNLTPSLSSGGAQTFPKPLGASTTKMFETIFATTHTNRTAMSLSAGILPLQPTASHSSATLVPITHMFSLPGNISAVATTVVSKETNVTMSEPSTLARSSTSIVSDVSTLSSAKVTTTSVPPLDQTASTINYIAPTHSVLTHSTSEAMVITVKITPTAVPSLTETPVPSLRPTTLMATKPEPKLLSTSVDTVTPSTPTLACSKFLPNNAPLVSSTHMITTMSIPVATQPISRVEETSTHTLSFPYTFSSSEDDVTLVTGTIETSVVDKTMPSHTSPNRLSTSVYGHISQFSTHLANTLVPTLSVTDVFTLSSDKKQMTTSLGNTPETMEVTEMSSSKYPFISESQSTSSFELTDTRFAETKKHSSHQTHSSSHIPLATPPDGISASSPASGSIPTWTSSNTNVDISEMSTNLRKTALPSQALTITTLLPPEKERMSVLSIYTPRTEKMIVSTTSLTRRFSYYQDTSFVDTPAPKTIRISNPVNTKTTLSHLLSSRTQPEVTSITSPIYESTQTSPESLSLSTTGLSSTNFTIVSTDRTTIVPPAPNVTMALLGKTSMATSIPIYQMYSLPVSVTSFTSKIISDTPTILMTKSSKTAPPDCLKSPSIVTSRPVSEMSSTFVHDSALLPVAVSSGTSTTVRSFSTLLSSITPRTTMPIQTSTLDITPVTYAWLASKKTKFSSAFTNSEITEMFSRITPPSFPSPTESTLFSVKTNPITGVVGVVTPYVGTTASSLHSSKITDIISSTLKTTFSPFLSTTQRSSQGHEATTLGILSGIINSSLYSVSSGRIAALTNTYSRIAAPKSMLSSTPSANLHTSLNIQVSSSLTSFKSTPGPTKSIKSTTYLSLNTKKMTCLSENTIAELTKGASVNAPVLYLSWTPSSTTSPSLTSFVFSPHSTETEFSITNTSLPPTSQMVEFPVLGTRTTSSNDKSLFMTSWNTPMAEESQFPTFTTTHVLTPNKMETGAPYPVPGSLSTVTASQTALISGDVMAMSSISTSGILPTLGMSESPSLSISSRSVPTILVDIKQTFEKTTTTITLGTIFPSNPSGAASGSIISKATTSPMLIWIFSSLPSGSPMATVSNIPHTVMSSTVEVSKSTFLTSDMIPTYLFTNFTTLPFPIVSTTLTKTTTMPTGGNITTGTPTSLLLSMKITDGSECISKSPEASSRTAVTANSRTVSQPSSFSRMSMSPPTTDHTLSIGSTLQSSPTITSMWSRIPAASTSPTLVFPKPTLDSLSNITTTTSTATRASFPLISTRITHPSTTILSSLLSSSFETTWLDSTLSFLSTETLTSRIATEVTVSFYNIKMSFSVFSEEPVIPITSVVNELAGNWLKSIFQDSEFSLTNLAIQIKSRDTSEDEITMDQGFWPCTFLLHYLEQREGQEMATISHVLYRCVCQVIIKANSSLAPAELISRIKSKIHGNFMYGNFTQDQLTLLVNSEYVAVKKLEPGKCKADKTASKYKGTYKWLLTNPTETAQTRCLKNEAENATRICSINIDTGKSQWEKPKYKQCKLLQELPDKIVNLANITISDENAEDIAEHVLNLINESSFLDEEETKIIISKLSMISQCDEISMNLTQIILQIVDATLRSQNNSASDLHEVSNKTLMIIEHVGHKMEFFGRIANLTVPNMALTVLRVDHTFEGIAFSIHSYKEGTDPEVYLNKGPLGRVLASIYLPKSLRKRILLSNLQTILFNFFGQTSLFKSKNIIKALTTYVVSASISDISIQNLADPVVITLQHIEGNQNYDQVQCTFWDFGNNNGQGGWNSSGCKVKETNINYTICHCDHLTHFGVLMDLSRSAVDAVNERILVLMTYTGCGISSIFLGVTIVTYIVFHKLRKDHPSKILINLCTALLMLNLVFLVNSWLSSFQEVGLCIAAAVALHYFLLVSLTWMGLEAVHMYFALVKVFNIYISNYILKFCVVGWGIPAIMVAVVLSVKKDLYGTLSSTSPFCWIKDDSLFYISVVAYFCLIFLMNFSMFCTVLAQLNSMKSQIPKTRRKMILHGLKGTISLTFLLGLTWGFAFFAWGPVKTPFLYLFAIFNTLQGFFIFVFHCVMKESVREQWQTHFCCRWLQLDNFSVGSSRCGLNVGYKQERLKKTFKHKLLMPSLKSTATSSTFKSLGSVQGMPSEIISPNDDFDEDPYYFSPLSCDVVPNCVRRILPVEIKMNSIHKQKFL